MNHIMLPYKNRDSVLQNKKCIKISIITTRIATETFFAILHWSPSESFPKYAFSMFISFHLPGLQSLLQQHKWGRNRLFFPVSSVIPSPKPQEATLSYIQSVIVFWGTGNFSEVFQLQKLKRNLHWNIIDITFGHIKFLCMALLPLLIRYCPCEYCEGSPTICLNYALIGS